MPSPCAFEGCRMTKEISRVIGLNISFFQIPKNEILRQQWLSKCKPRVNLKHSLVCSLHFEEKDFERDLKAELLNLKPKLLLKKTAIPTRKGETENQEINDQLDNNDGGNEDNFKPRVNLKHSLVCSLHFEEKDFERDLKAELLNLKPKLLLKKTAIPTRKGETENQEINDQLDNNDGGNEDVIKIIDKEKETDRHTIEISDNVETQPSFENIEIIDCQKIIYTDMSNVEVPPANIEIEIIDYQEDIPSTEAHPLNGGIETRVIDLQIDTSQLREENYQGEIESTNSQSLDKGIENRVSNLQIEASQLREENYQEKVHSTEAHLSLGRTLEGRVSDLQIEVSQLREENYKLKRKLTRKQKIILRQRRQNNTLSQVIRNFKSKQNREAKKVVDQIIRNKLTDVFTSKQLDKILTKKQVRWTDEDISIAFTLRCLSKPCYLYLRNSLNYPLPGETTIHSWCSKINMD